MTNNDLFDCFRSENVFKSFLDSNPRLHKLEASTQPLCYTTDYSFKNIEQNLNDDTSSTILKELCTIPNSNLPVYLKNLLSIINRKVWKMFYYDFNKFWLILSRKAPGNKLFDVQKHSLTDLVQVWISLDSISQCTSCFSRPPLLCFRLFYHLWVKTFMAWPTSKQRLGSTFTLTL